VEKERRDEACQGENVHWFGQEELGEAEDLQVLRVRAAETLLRYWKEQADQQLRTCDLRVLRKEQGEVGAAADVSLDPRQAKAKIADTTCQVLLQRLL
jgi:hypothetical protein